MVARGTENQPLGDKALHHRHKSASNINIMSSVNASSKASLNANVTDAVNRGKPTASNDAAMSKAKSISKGVVAVAQENRGHIGAKDAFLQPAQRPPKSLQSSTSMTHLRPTTTESRPIAKPTGTFGKRGRPIPIFKDNQIEPEPEKHEPRQSSASNASQAPTSSKGDAQSKSDGHLEGRLDEFHMAESPKPSQKGDHLSTRPAEEDVTEAIYLDAVEELSNEASPVSASDYQKELSDGWQSPKLDDYVGEPDVVVHEDHDVQNDIPDYEEVSTDARASKPLPIPTDDQVEFSDYEDGDYSDDQGYTGQHSPGATTGFVTMVVVPPKLTKKGEAEVDAAKAHVLTKNWEEPSDDYWDIGMVAEYSDEIFEYMREMEIQLLPKAHYMDIQNEIQWSMRSVLIDWLAQVHLRFGLLPETLYLAVNVVDRFLSVKIVSMSKLQLVGATALMIAAKYEEINCPSLSEMVFMVEGGYAPEEILKAERFMLSQLEFTLGYPGPMSFMRRISKADDYDSEIRTVAKYFAEVTLMDERFVSTPPSYVAAGSQCLARLMLNKGEWTQEHVYYSGYTFTQLKPLMATIMECCYDPSRHHNAIYKKYSTKQFKCASIFVVNMVEKGFELPFQNHAHVLQKNGIDDSRWGLTMPLPSYPTVR
ncbi:cyclin-like protein [Annulohypoxylon truncatum]|uniref:cyclin-like protein n=1 Tax=Annulohypoxylon truncatum TaxID=327061 RepID=UPI0020080757|nr:cyclin-like protein [Annulohypoxylon truncatum]KAI1206291.1 cyclin-like protein [Annulohypoxylon truncatum]